VSVLDRAAPFDIQQMSKCGSAIKSLTIYDKDNQTLRPLLRNYSNVEANVQTLKLRDTCYQIAAELTDP